MKRFSLNENIADAYAMQDRERRPVIGITGNYDELSCRLAEGYYKQVVRAGGVPLIIPPVSDTATIIRTLEKIDGLLLSGGADINPLYAGEQPVQQLGTINSERDMPELMMARLAFNRQLPMLGICRGIQTMAIALGGHVCQHISTTVKHSQQADRNTPTHTVTITPDTLLYNIYHSAFPVSDDNVVATLPVNSFHHQAVDQPGPHFRAVATAPDGIIEAIESTEMKPFIGVQWHPECMADDGLPLFRWLVGEAQTYHRVQTLHDNILTLDTHCDTPMLFAEGIDFSRRCTRALVDLPKMREGRLDATIMVAYLPQGTPSPRAYADNIFDQIEAIVRRNKNQLSLARTTDELWKAKRQGRKSIMLGIENGHALEGDIANVEHFAQRGVVYITLCHNGDNDLCDSAKGTQTHGGVSTFGEQVIHEMNRLGLMVDLSHAHERSFYDALDISSTPIVCSHSSCRALCDHPRNLTDEQMRRLADRGGVCQITLYPGFLRTTGEATILDAMAHVDHAVKVMGIDHVGLGTDFDGDGGVCGLADASELLLFTRQLLQRRYNSQEISRLWGGNFLRLMKRVQANQV